MEDFMLCRVAVPHSCAVGAHAEQQMCVEDQRHERLTRLGFLFLPFFLQFDAQKVLLFWFLFKFVFYRPWGPWKELAGSVHS